MAPMGPIPGKTPTRVPMSTPAAQKNRLVGSRVTLKPKMMLWKKSILFHQRPKNPDGNWQFNHTEKM